MCVSTLYIATHLSLFDAVGSFHFARVTMLEVEVIVVDLPELVVPRTAEASESAHAMVGWSQAIARAVNTTRIAPLIWHGLSDHEYP